MSFDFPATPTEDQEYTPSGGPTYVYKAPRWMAKAGNTEYSALNDQTGTTYTFALTDIGVLVSGNNAAAQTFTVPPNSAVAFPVRVRIDLWQKGAGQIAVAAGAGVTIRSSGAKLKLTGQYSAATLTKIATDEWFLFGDIAS